ncbi:MAG: DUF1836 domain-containing protein [Eubacteriales bacterium]|nr:DUF1836 domain-containing protein [Eubacteriales bacterium]
MKKEKNDAIKQPLIPEDFSLPRYRDIPDVGLLLEQTARLINGYMEPLTSIRITNSMISNYVKQGIIGRPVKKLYYRKQIAELIFISLSKTVLSLDDTRVVLSLQRASYPVDTAYNYFCRVFEDILIKSYLPDIEFSADGTDLTKTPEGRSTSAFCDAAKKAASGKSRDDKLISDAYLVERLAVSIADCIHLQLLIAERHA